MLQAQRAAEQAHQTDDDQVNGDNEIQKLGHDEDQDASDQRDERSKGGVEIHVMSVAGEG